MKGKALTSVLVVTAMSTQAWGIMLAHDDFNRANGNLVGTLPTPGPGGMWATHSGTVGPVQISGNQISVVQAASTIATEDVNVPLGVTMGAGDRFYAAFDLTVPTPAGAITSTYFAHFLQGTSNFDSRIWIAAPTVSGFRLALSNDNSNTDADGEVFTGDLAFDTTYRIVHYYDYSGQNAVLWINPVTELSPSFAATDPGFSHAITAYAFRQGSPTSGGTTQNIDNLCVATDFNEALTCIPEPGSLGLLLIGGTLLSRRRRV